MKSGVFSKLISGRPGGQDLHIQVQAPALYRLMSDPAQTDRGAGQRQCRQSCGNWGRYSPLWAYTEAPGAVRCARGGGRRSELCRECHHQGAGCGQHSDLPAIADDSGLEVDFLNGAPGIYSARYSGAGDEANNTRYSRSWAILPRRSAAPASNACWSTCATPWTHTAGLPGQLGRLYSFRAQGTNGFGYDPLFLRP